MPRFNRIDLRMDDDARRHEHTMKDDEAIYPGMRIEVNSDGEVLKCDAAGALGVVRIAVEDVLQGKEPDDVYANDAIVFSMVPKPGEEMAVLVKSGETVAIGSALIANASGLYIVSTGTPAQTDFEAQEAYTPSGNELVRAMKI